MVATHPYLITNNGYMLRHTTTENCYLVGVQLEYNKYLDTDSPIITAMWGSPDLALNVINLYKDVGRYQNALQQAREAVSILIGRQTYSRSNMPTYYETMAACSPTLSAKRAPDTAH
jgi:hypothetical protein